MNIILAKNAGFCFGVRKAMEAVENTISSFDGKIYTLGPIIHNETVIGELRERGVFPVDLDDIKPDENTSVIIRSHGISKAVEEKLVSFGVNIVDATCPFVKKIHRLVKEHSEKGEYVVVFGDSKHAEVKGIIGWICGNDYSVLSDACQTKKFSLNKTKPVFVVAQTTFNYKLFQECVEILKQKGYDVSALDTICPATYERQKEAEQIAAKVGAMIVIGGRDSSNSKKLYDICKSKCDITVFVQTKEDFDPTVLQTIDDVGITAGASTPDKIIREVMMECQK